MKERFTVVGVISSARPESNSAAMVRAAMRGAEMKGAIVHEIYLPGSTMGFCRGCLSCVETGHCFQDDDFNGIRELLYQADGIIWGAPTYAGGPNAMMKNLIDRLGMYEVFTSSLGGKYMVGISAFSTNGGKKVASWLSHLGNAGTFLRSYTSGSLAVKFSRGRTAVNDRRVLEGARVLGEKLAGDIRTGKRYRLQGIPMRIMTSLIMRPILGSYIAKNKEGRTKVSYDSLKLRGLIA